MRDQIKFARTLRRNQTDAERQFWALLHPWREQGLHWRRQAPIGSYVADFCCKRLKLIVEIDGDTHYSDAAISHDEVRMAFLRQRGFAVLCFTNYDVLERDGAYSASYAAALANLHPNIVSNEDQQSGYRNTASFGAKCGGSGCGSSEENH